MDRVNAILRHPRFIRGLERLGQIERTALVEGDYTFCNHGMDHLLDVARIAYALCLESERLPTPEGSNEKELVYAAALLHDAGRARQYEDGTPHEVESARIAAEMLPECGFDEAETGLILDAILAHRTREGAVRFGIAEYIYKADKLSRRCFDCAAADACDWEIKNSVLVY